MPLAPGFSLSEVERFRPEMEFLYKEGDNFVKGFIDLVFCHGEKIYLLDWKSNWLKEYTQSSLEKAMQEHDYGLQARLYAKALSAHAKSLSYGGAFYVFLRGEAAVFV